MTEKILEKLNEFDDREVDGAGLFIVPLRIAVRALDGLKCPWCFLDKKHKCMKNEACTALTEIAGVLGVSS